MKEIISHKRQDDNTIIRLSGDLGELTNKNLRKSTEGHIQVIFRTKGSRLHRTMYTNINIKTAQLDIVGRTSDLMLREFIYNNSPLILENDGGTVTFEDETVKVSIGRDIELEFGIDFEILKDNLEQYLE